MWRASRIVRCHPPARPGMPGASRRRAYPAGPRREPARFHIVKSRPSRGRAPPGDPGLTAHRPRGRRRAGRRRGRPGGRLHAGRAGRGARGAPRRRVAAGALPGDQRAARVLRRRGPGGRSTPPCERRLLAETLADHPATGITYAARRRLCAWASARLGRRVRLPRGAEWEAAARGPDARPWPWGASFDPDRCACVEGGAWTTAPVDAHPGGAAPCGAQQLAGNVWEWVADARRATAGAPCAAALLDHGWGLRASRVLPADPGRATHTTGFRVAIDPDPPTPRRRCHDPAARTRPRAGDRRPARRLRPLLRRPRHQHRGHGRRGGRPRGRRRTCAWTSCSPPAGARSWRRCPRPSPRA